jgi:cytochrome c oxidase cbb3-type subunit I/II
VKTIAAGKFLGNEAASAPGLAPAYVAQGEDNFWHRVIERRPFQMLIFSLVVILIGTAAELIPTFLISSNEASIEAVKPYTSLEVAGRDLYIREGCVGCHSQLVRPFRSETERYGEYSKMGEFAYDHPFLWGSKRTGPDLHRLGGKYPHSWHYHHMNEPGSMSPGSIMPSYPWLIADDLKKDDLPQKLEALKAVGVPYDAAEIQNAVRDADAQALSIAKSLKAEGVQVEPGKEIVALIAYMQRLGTDIKKTNTASVLP